MFRPKFWLIAHAIAVGLFCQGFPFFWDTVQLSAKQAYWFYENGFGDLLLPNELDSGHPPLMGLYLAAVWMVFGKSLVVSHWAMFPFLLLINFSLFALIRQWVASPRDSLFLMLLFWLDPVLAGQLVLVSPDIILAGFFLLALRGIQTDDRRMVTLGVTVLALISMRGMMTAAALALYEWWRGAKPKQGLAYLPGLGLALAFLGYHYWQKGWIGYHAGSPWAPSFSGVTDPMLLLRNGAILLWRLLDFGRIFVWLGLFLLLRSTNSFKGLQLKSFALPLTIALVFFPVVLAYAHLSAHRYLLPLFLALHLVLVQVLAASRDVAVAKKIYWGVLVGLALGNAWVYPRTIAQGWDSTLAHVPYYRLRREALGFLENQGIPIDSVGTAFPEIGPLKYRDLSDSQAGMQEKNLCTQRYVYDASVMNDFSEEELAALKKDWLPLKTFGRYPVRIVLYQKMDK